MTLNELKRTLAAQPQTSPQIEVHGVDLSLYLVYRRDGDALHPIMQGARALRFQSRYAALKALKEVGLVQADFVHRSAFDEMVGLQSSATGAELRETVNLNHIKTR